jgi:hypothetical protein
VDEVVFTPDDKTVERYTRKDLEYLNRHIITIGRTFVQVDSVGFGLLLDYSCSLPTGQADGKVWKRRVKYTDGSAGWQMGEYVDVGDPKRYAIRWRHMLVSPT